MSVAPAMRFLPAQIWISCHESRTRLEAPLSCLWRSKELGKRLPRSTIFCSLSSTRSEGLRIVKAWIGMVKSVGLRGCGDLGRGRKPRAQVLGGFCNVTVTLKSLLPDSIRCFADVATPVERTRALSPDFSDARFENLTGKASMVTSAGLPRRTFTISVSSTRPPL